jgi:hypothetical protein
LATTALRTQRTTNHPRSGPAKPNTISLDKVIEGRQRQRKHGLKDRVEFEAQRAAFVAQKGPVLQPKNLKTLQKKIVTMDAPFYGDHSRHEEDPTAWIQNLNAKRVANDWTDKKAINVFVSLLVEEKKAWKWWHTELGTSNPTMDRTKWDEVRAEFKKRWPPLPEPEDDMELKREELEQMKLEPDTLGKKILYRGQELYTHVAFAIETTHLAAEIRDTMSFLLPTVRNKLPEALWNVLKSLGKKPKTWDEFRNAVTTVSPTDLREEVAEIATRESIYAEVRSMSSACTGLTPTMARAALPSPRPLPSNTPTFTKATIPVPITMNTTPAPKYQQMPPTPRTPTQNRPMYETTPQKSPANPFQTTPVTNHNILPSPATGTNATPIGTNPHRNNDPSNNWDRRQPYPRTAEGKAAYEKALQAWWNRNGFNARATATDLLPLSPGTAPLGSRECFNCGRNDYNDTRFPHKASTCPITPKIPYQEKMWRIDYANQGRNTRTNDEPDHATIQQLESYDNGMPGDTHTETNQGNETEPTA